MEHILEGSHYVFSTIDTIKIWIERFLSTFLKRPFVFMLVMSLWGGYAGFYASRRLCAVCILSAAFLGIIEIRIIKRKKKSYVPVIAGLLAFLGFMIWFAHESGRLAGYKNGEYYSGLAIIQSSDKLQEGYKTIILQLEDGERVTYLTDGVWQQDGLMEVAGTLNRIQSAGNPGDLDVKSYYRKQGIVRAIDVDHILHYEGPKDLIRSRILSISASVREKCHELWERNMDAEGAMLLSAMLLGDSTYLDKETKGIFRKSNLSHLLVVSGAHVGYFTATIAFLLAGTSFSRKRRTVILCVFVVLFGFVTGWGSSATRSILTYICVSFLSWEERQPDRLSACAMSGLILMILEPYSIFASGLLLSFGATFSILLFYRRLARRLRMRFPVIPEEVIRAVSCYFCAVTGMLPVLLTLGSRISLLNIFVVILVGFPAELLCSLGIVVTSVCWLIPWDIIHKILFLPIRGLAELLILMARTGSNSGLIRITVQNASLFCIVIFFGAILMGSMSSGIRKRVLSFCVSISVAVEGWMFFFPEKDSVRVFFLDVGQGDAALICCNKGNYLIDGGNVGSGTKLQSVMDYLDIPGIDGAFASHLDSDHIGGLVELDLEGKVRQFYSSFWEESSEMNQLSKLYECLPDSVMILKKGMTLEIDKEFVLHVVWPNEPSDGGNEDSLVLWAEIFGTNILFTGDIGAETEKMLLSDIPEHIDILKVAHHGSRFSTCDDFVRSKKIDAAVISVGYNFYGHPSKEVIGRLEAYDIPCFRTDENGCVLLEIRENGWTIDYYF